jgi:anti-sigma-K factor RskA
MSGARPESPEELHMLAGEYVLCVLDSDEMRAVDRQASSDPQLTRAIAGWEQRLAPMLTAVDKVAPPAALWARIQQSASLAPAEAPRARPALRLASTTAQPPAAAWPRPVASTRAWPWKTATGASLALAAGLAAFLLMPSLSGRPDRPMPGGHDVALVATLTQPDSPGETRPDTSPQMANATGTATISEPSDTSDAARTAGRAGFLAATWPDGTVVLTAFAPVTVPAGKALELWIQPPDAKTPKSLGVLPASGQQQILSPAPVAGTALTVTIEPSGGSPTGAPTGRVVYAGTLRPARR